VPNIRRHDPITDPARGDPSWANPCADPVRRNPGADPARGDPARADPANPARGEPSWADPITDPNWGNPGADAAVDGGWEERLSPAAAWRAQWNERVDHLLASSAVTPLAIRRIQRIALSQGFVVTSAQLLAAGISRAESRSLVRRRLWSAPHRGTLAVTSVSASVSASVSVSISASLSTSVSVPAGGDGKVAAALRASAISLTRSGAIVSHESAAVLHGLPTRTTPATATLTLVPTAPIGRSGAVLHRAALDRVEIADWHGIPVTSVARTVLDIARADRGAGLMAADAALRERLTSRASLRATAVECAGWVGNTAARWVADYADPLAESPLESLVRECLLMGGVPRPQLQGVVRDVGGWSARVDMLWAEQRVIVEVDGRVKYGDDGRSLWREKRRQERLERLGYRVVRILWSDLVREPELTIARVLAALAS
jgi:very-short-patch-repair endonuclease